jgi:quinol monooxygenase YgiN
MSYISTLRFQIKQGTAPDIERLIQERLVPVRQELLTRGDVLSMLVIRAEEPANMYEVITHWASKEAHDRNENSPAEQAGLAAAAAYMAAAPVELAGSLIVELT